MTQLFFEKEIGRKTENFEKAPKLQKSEKKTGNIDPKELLRLMDKGKRQPENRIQNQMLLAYQLHKETNADNLEQLSMADTNEFMFRWAEEDGAPTGMAWSKAYSEIEKDPDFKNHPRLKGETTNITLDDVIYFRQRGRIPQD